MKHLYTSQYAALEDCAVEFGISEAMADDTHNLRIKAHEVLHDKSGGWDSNSLIASAEYTFNLSVEQLVELSRRLNLFLSNREGVPTPAIDDIIRNIEESEANA